MPTCNKSSDRSNTSLDALLRDVEAVRKRGRSTRSAAKGFLILAMLWSRVRHPDVESTSLTLSLNTRSTHLGRWRRISFNICETLQAHAKLSKGRPVVLLLDSHDSHLSIEALDYCKRNGVTVLSFPPHCSHKLQSLDVSVYGPLKTYVNRACDTWVTSHPGHAVKIYDVPGILNLSYHLGFSCEQQNRFPAFRNLPHQQGYFSWRRRNGGLR